MEKMSKGSSAAAYRIPMEVRSIKVIGWGSAASSYPVCPKCGLTLEREYQHFCDRCGQALDWKHFSQANVVLVE